MTDQPNRPKGKTGRPACRTALDLPIPPSTNALWRYGQGKVHRSAEYMAWIKQAGWELRLQKPTPIPSPVAIRLKAGLPDKPRDLDNLAKAALDLLQAHGVVADDVSVVDLRMLWDKTVPKGRVHITAWRTLAPAHRIGAETRAKVSVACRAAFRRDAA